MPVTWSGEQPSQRIAQGADRPQRRRRATRGLTLRAVGSAPLLSLTMAMGVAVMLPTQHAHAQANRLDSGTLVDGLRELGLADLLGYYARNQAPNDGLTPQLVEIASLRMQLEDANLTMDQRRTALNAAVEGQQALIASNQDHPLRPLWQTDLAEMCILRGLMELNTLAPDFYSLGVPTAEQTDVYRRYIRIAVNATENARVTLDAMRETLPRRGDYQQAYVATGLEDRIFNEYAERRTPLYGAMATLYASYLPENDAYFTNPQGPEQYRDYASEYERLLQMAVGQADQVMDGAGLSSFFERLARTVYAQAMMELGEYADAEGVLRRVVQASELDFNTMRAAGVLAYAQAQDNALDRALQTLEENSARFMQAYATRPAQLPFELVFLADVEHKLLAEAGRSADESYAPYLTMLDSLPQGDLRNGFLQYVSQRWRDDMQGGGAEGLPVSARSLLGEYLFGIAMTQQREQDADWTQTMQDAMDVHDSLRDAQDVSVRARASFYYNYGNQAMNPQSLPATLEAASNLVDLAVELGQDHPDNPVGPQAAEWAANWMLNVHQQLAASGQDIAQIPEALTTFRNACEVQLSLFRTTQGSDNLRVYYAARDLIPAYQFMQAQRVLEGVPASHEDFLESQRLALVSLWLAISNSGMDNPTRRDAAAREIERLGGTLQGQDNALEAAFPDDDAPYWIQQQRERIAVVFNNARLNNTGVTLRTELDELASALRRRVSGQNDLASQRAAVTAGIIEARLTLPQPGVQSSVTPSVAASRAIETLDELDPLLNSPEAQQDAAMQSLAVESLEVRMSALTTAGNLNAVRQTAQTFMQDSPQRAVPVLYQVITNIERQLQQDEARAAVLPANEAAELRRSMQPRGQAAAEIADMLVTSAIQQGMSPRDLAPVRFIQSRATWLAGDPAEALRIVNGVLQQNPDQVNSLSYLHHHAEALYHAGVAANNQQNLTQAFAKFRLIAEAPQLSGQVDPPGEWWNAQLRMLQIADELNQATNSIARRIRQLETRGSTIPLGGEPYASGFRALKEKYPN